jgi:nicotinate-nucleotide adenylyltransferase
MRIAFFGGSFDPPHRGHLMIARAAVRRLALDWVWMAPVGSQPLKPDGFSVSFSDRLAMVQLAVAGDSHIVASDVDAPRSDGHPNYTIDVLPGIVDSLPISDKLFFLLGADAFLSLKQWRGADRLPFLCEFIVAGRPGFSVDDIQGALPEDIVAEREAPPDCEEPGANIDESQLAIWRLRNNFGEESRLYLMPDLHEETSATDVRAALAGEQSAEGVLAPAVLHYIEEHELYR